MQESLREKFADDWNIVGSKFFLQQANLSFVNEDLEASKASAEKGLELALTPSVNQDADTKQAQDRTKRDLLNLIIRIRSRLEKTDARTLRIEESKKQGLGITFLAQHEDQ